MLRGHDSVDEMGSRVICSFFRLSTDMHFLGLSPALRSPQSRETHEQVMMGNFIAFLLI